MNLEKILNDDKKKIGTYENSYSTKITFQQLSDICNNRKKYKLLDPPFQIPIDENKIDEMVKAHLKNPHFLLSKIIITIAVVCVGNEKEYYLMDGQHRMNMIKIIHETTQENNNMIVVVHHVTNEEDMRELFDELNKDSSKNLGYVSLPIFGKIIIEQLNKKLAEKYKGAYAESKNSLSSIFTINEFTSFLQDADYFKTTDVVTDIIDKIDKKHKTFFNTLKYLENANNDKKFLKKEMDIISNYRNVMFFKNNNFIEYLINNDAPTHDDIEKRKSITDDMRKKVWKNEFGNNKVGICPVVYCKTQLTNRTKHGFQCGHIISLANKGPTEEKNLRPICANCNSKMSSQNWNNYEDELKREHEWNKKYDDDEEDAECDDCEKNIKKDNFHLVLVKKNKTKYKLVCRKCSKDYPEKIF